MAYRPDPNKLRNLGMTLFVLITIGLTGGFLIERLDRCTHWPQYMSGHC
jgi:hypothetical protein